MGDTLMTYQEMVDTLSGLSEEDRRVVIQNHWQAVLSDGFIAFVQGQIEAGRAMVFRDPDLAEAFAELDPSIAVVLKRQALSDVARLVEVWDSMAAVYVKLQKQSERQGNAKGMVAHGRHDAMPRGVTVTGAVQCYRCGSPAVRLGLCNACVVTQQDWEQEDLDYDRQRYERAADDQQYRRLQDDQIFYDNQRDFNTYPTYPSEH
jgi:hypothetical protein